MAMFNLGGMASNALSLGRYAASRVPWRSAGRWGLGMAAVGGGIGMIGAAMNKIDAPPGVNRSMIKGGLGGAFGGPLGAIGGGIKGGLLGAAAGAGFFGARGMRGSWLAAGAGRWGIRGAMIGAGLGFLKGSVRANQPVNKIRGFY